MEEADGITQRRLDIWNNYHRWFASQEEQGKLRRPVIPTECKHNAHMYYLLLPNLQQRSAFIDSLKEQGIFAVFHYNPLHKSPMGMKYGRTSGELINTLELSERLVRLPLWLGMEDDLVDIIQRIITTVDMVSA
jgi:dTDP-4-amino-4,6-dideoxygalactose transaminase